MYNYTLSMVFGCIAMLCAMSSYFFKNKKLFLLVQGGAILFLALSQLFVENYFAMISYCISMVRVIVYSLYEKRQKSPPFYVMSIFAVLTVGAFVGLNISTFKALDILFMIATVCYAYTFGIKNMQILRYMFIIPTAISLSYFILDGSVVFVIISYAFELVANVVALIIYYVRARTFKQASKLLMPQNENNQNKLD